MRATLVLAVTALLTIAAVPAGVGPATADGFVSVSTTIEPEQPTVDESFTVTATVTNADDSTERYRLTEATLREGRSDSTDPLTQADDDEATTAPSVDVGVGESVTVSVNATVDEPETRQIFLHLTLLDENGDEQRVVQPVTVQVIEPHPQVGVTAESAAPGESRPVSVTVSNGFDERITNVELTVGGERVTVTNDRRVTAGIEPNENRVFEFSATPETESRLPVEVTLRYTIDGDRRTVTREVTADFAAAGGSGEQPQVELSVQEAIPGAERLVNVTIANGADEELRQVRVLVNGEQVSFGETERVRARLAAGETRTFRFPASVTEAGRYPVNVTVVYTDDGVRERVSRTIEGDFTGPDAPGTVALTSVTAVVSNGELSIDATASNPGTSDVGGVTVTIGETDAVGSGDFFVGEIEASDFQPFTLRVPVSGDVSSVPLRVSYVVDGVQRSFTTEVPVAVAETPAPSDDGGGLPLVALGGVVAALVVAGVVVLRRR